MPVKEQWRPGEPLIEFVVSDPGIANALLGAEESERRDLAERLEEAMWGESCLVYRSLMVRRPDGMLVAFYNNEVGRKAFRQAIQDGCEDLSQ